MISGKKLALCLFLKNARWRTQGAVGQSALLQFLEKIMEHVLSKLISKHAKGKKVIKISQHKFTKGKSYLST